MLKMSRNFGTSDQTFHLLGRTFVGMGWLIALAVPDR